MAEELNRRSFIKAAALCAPLFAVWVALDYVRVLRRRRMPITR